MDVLMQPWLWFGNQWWQVAILLIDLVVRLWAIGFVPENRNPASSTAWLILILLVPIVGFPLFLLIGSQSIKGRRHQIQAAANEEIVRRTAHLPDIPKDLIDGGDFERSEELQYSIRLSRRLTKLPAAKANCQAVYSGYTESIAAMTKAINEAKDTVHVQMYIFALDPTTQEFVDAILAAHRRGVMVRVLVDPIGSQKYPGYRKLRSVLNEAGVSWHPMLPIDLWRLQWRRPDLRNHRKIVVVDGQRAFLGSLNMIEPQYQKRRNHAAGRRWEDVMIELMGDVVTHLDAVFAVDWTSEGHEPPVEQSSQPVKEKVGDSDRINVVQVLPSGPGYETVPNLRVYNDLIYQARERIVVVSPYFVPDESLMMALTTAAHAGVEVILQVNEKGDQFMVNHAQQSYYTELLKAGVRILRYPAPAILHSKFLIIDGRVATVGSSNLDMRSFELNYEVTLLAARGCIVDDLERIAAGYAEVSTELSLEEWQKRPFISWYLDNVFRLTSALQ